VPPDVIGTIIWIESYCDPNMVGASGERGLMQIMPGTARYIEAQIGLDADLIMSDPAANVEAGTFYFSLWYHRFGRLDLALSSFNGGPGHVIESGEVWLPTRGYVDKALDHLGSTWQLGLEPMICARGNEACLEEHP
jgi:soluble lytic murein transglycosylase-like protein